MWGEVSPSWRKSRATLQLLTGSESLMGVWITCLSPAPREIVLCKRKQTQSPGKQSHHGQPELPPCTGPGQLCLAQPSQPLGQRVGPRHTAA